jgi:hypothetical protein
MTRPINLDSVELAMLDALSKKARQTKEQYLKALIKNEYQNMR